MSAPFDLQREQKLVAKAKESLQAFDKLYEHYLPRIYGFVYNRTRNQAIAEDVTSQAFIKAMSKIKSFSYRGYTFGAWLYRIAHNTLIDYFRKHPDVQIIDIEQLKSDDKTSDEALRAERQGIILEAMRRLPKQYQEVLSLKYFEDLTNEEIADILGCKKETLAVKLHRSLKAMKKVLEEKSFQKLLNTSV